MASPNRYSIQTRFTVRFLRALKRLTGRRSTSGSPPNTDLPRSKQTYYRRYRIVRRAAYASMASAVGRRRKWSRAQLLKIRRPAQLRRKIGGGCGAAPAVMMRRRRIVTENDVVFDGGNSTDDHRTTKELRQLVPGGEVMDFCSLLDETAHYINCLTSQVQIMRNIADLFST